MRRSLSILLMAALSSPWDALGQGAVGEFSQTAPLASQSLLLDITPVGGGFMAVGERGHVLRSADGLTWTQLQVPTRAILCAIATVPSDRIWIAGHDGVILHSADGGDDWVVQRLAPEEEAPLFDLWFEDARHGIAVGAYGSFLETFDGGTTWSSRLIDEGEPHFFTIVEASSGDLFLGGEFGALFRSVDRAQNWTRLASPYGGSFFGLLSTRDGGLIGYGLRGRVYRSTDQGASFQQSSTPTTAGLLGGVEHPDGSIVLVGLSGAVLLSQDGGVSFVAADREDRVGISTVLVKPDGELLAVGEKGAFLLESHRED